MGLASDRPGFPVPYFVCLTWQPVQVDQACWEYIRCGSVGLCVFLSEGDLVCMSWSVLVGAMLDLGS